MLFYFLLLGPILFTTVLIHELGHALAARSVGGSASSILLWPLGGLAYVAHDRGPKADVWVSVAGPLTHLPMIGIWLLAAFLTYHDKTDSFSIDINQIYPEENLGHAICAASFWLNISLLVFNLFLPAYPLDGGRIFTDLMLICGVPKYTAAWVTIGVASVIGVGIVVRGFIIGTSGFMIIFVGLWMLFSTYQLFKFVQANALDKHPMFNFDQEREELPSTYAQDATYAQDPEYPPN